MGRDCEVEVAIFFDSLLQKHGTHHKLIPCQGGHMHVRQHLPFPLVLHKLLTPQLSVEKIKHNICDRRDLC